MIACSKCGKENQDHYKFCLGCGSELAAAAAPSARPVSSVGPLPATPPRHTGRPEASPVSPTPAAGTPPVPGEEEFAPPPITSRGTSSVKGAQAADQSGLRTTEPEETPAPAGKAASGAACPSCGTPNPKEFVFCGNCGTRLHSAAPPRTVQLAGKARPSAEGKPLAKLGLIRPDGSEGGTHLLREAESIIGRGSGPLFDHDSYLSPSHARLSFENGITVVEDIGSLNGLFVKIKGEEPLRGNDIFRIGQELLRFDAILEPQVLEDGTEIMGSPNPGYWGRLRVIMGPGLDGSAFPLMGDEMVLGRERGDILFSDDGYVSGTHAKIGIREDGYFLTDLGSSNGTFIRITQPREIASGTFILIGQQLFRFELL